MVVLVKLLESKFCLLVVSDLNILMYRATLTFMTVRMASMVLFASLMIQRITKAMRSVLLNA